MFSLHNPKMIQDSPGGSSRLVVPPQRLTHVTGKKIRKWEESFGTKWACRWDPSASGKYQQLAAKPKPHSRSVNGINLPEIENRVPPMLLNSGTQDGSLLALQKRGAARSHPHGSRRRRPTSPPSPSTRARRPAGCRHRCARRRELFRVKQPQDLRRLGCSFAFRISMISAALRSLPVRLARIRSKTENMRR